MYLVSSRHLGHVELEKSSYCISCKLAKQARLPFNKSETISSSPFDLIHSNVWGPSRTTIVKGACYYVIFVVDFSRYTWIYVLSSRSDILKIYQDFSIMVQTQFSRTIKRFCVDSSRKY